MTNTETAYVPAALHFTRLSEPEALERSREFLARLAQRRSVRQFSPEPVPRELLENALRAAGTAPSGANQQPWTFVVVSDPELKERIRTAAEHEEELLYTERASDEYVRETAGTTPVDELHKLNDLKEKGAISNEEFERMKGKLLAS